MELFVYHLEHTVSIRSPCLILDSALIQSLDWVDYLFTGFFFTCTYVLFRCLLDNNTGQIFECMFVFSAITLTETIISIKFGAKMFKETVITNILIWLLVQVRVIFISKLLIVIHVTVFLISPLHLFNDSLNFLARKLRIDYCLFRAA